MTVIEDQCTVDIGTGTRARVCPGNDGSLIVPVPSEETDLNGAVAHWIDPKNGEGNVIWCRDSDRTIISLDGYERKVAYAYEDDGAEKTLSVTISGRDETTELPGCGPCHLVLTGESIVVEHNSYNTETKRLTVIDRTTMRVRWSVEVADQMASQMQSIASDATELSEVSPQTRSTALGPTSDRPVVCSEGSVVAIGRETGSIAAYNIMSGVESFVCKGDLVDLPVDEYIPGWDGCDFVVYDSRTGNEVSRWEHVDYAEVVAMNGEHILFEPGEVIPPQFECWNLESGEVQWSLQKEWGQGPSEFQLVDVSGQTAQIDPLPVSFRSPPKFGYGRAVLSGIGFEGTIALDLSTGGKLWSNTEYVGTPHIGPQDVYLTGKHGTVHALNGTDGSHQWTFTPEGKNPEIVATESAVYVSCSNGVVHMLDSSQSNGPSDTSIYVPNRCPKCGARLDKYSSVEFCPGCGTDV